jgi:hypothetical protein
MVQKKICQSYYAYRLKKKNSVNIPIVAIDKEKNLQKSS